MVYSLSGLLLVWRSNASEKAAAYVSATSLSVTAARLKKPNTLV